MSEAERIKKSHGVATTSLVNDAEEIAIIQAGNERKILRKYLSEIIEPRTEELLDLIKRELMSCSGYDIASTGLVLTGGGSLLKGLDKMAEAFLGLPVRIGTPRYVTGGKDLINNPMYSTGVGLVLYGMESESRKGFYPDMFTGIFGKMTGWVKGIFR